MADMVSGTHCVSFEMCQGVNLEQQIAVINSLANPISITRHLVLKDLDLKQTMPFCRSMLDALKLLWSLEVYDRCLSERQLRVLRMVRSLNNLGCIRKDYTPGEKCKFHSRVREEALDASFERFWANAGMDD